MPTVQEIKQHYEGEKTKLLTECFDIAAKARQVDISMKPTVKDRLGPKEFNAVKAAEGELFAQDERERLKTKYIELDLEMLAAIQVRADEVEQELAPKNATFQDFAAAASASPEALIAAMDLAIQSGDEDAALVAFAAGRQRDLEEVVAHAVDLSEEWGALYAELQLAQNQPELDPGDVFEMYAQPVPSRHEILGGPQRDINVYGQMGTG
jgi:hypothetical protein